MSINDIFRYYYNRNTILLNLFYNHIHYFAETSPAHHEQFEKESSMKSKSQIVIAAVVAWFTTPALAATQQEVQQAWTEVTQALNALTQNPAAAAISEVRQQFQNHTWRTVYEFTQVSKSPLPGTRLGIQALPYMSQLDAENYLVSTQFPNLPGMNCPGKTVKLPFGKPQTIGAGRPLTLTVGGRSVNISDAQLRAMFLKASPTEGARAYDTFIQGRDNLCTGIYNFAQLSFRWSKAQSVKTNWEACQKDGVYLSKWEKTEEFHFPGNHHRHASVGGGVLFYCGGAKALDSNNQPTGTQAGYTGSDGGKGDSLNYETWFKWSDKDREPLNILQTIRNAGDSPNKCPDTCIPLIRGGSASASVCIGIDPGLSAVGDTIPMRFGAKFRAYDRNKSLCTPVVSIPAPFGVMQSLGEMADSAKQNAMNKLKDQLVSLLPVSGQTKDKLSKLASLM